MEMNLHLPHPRAAVNKGRSNSSTSYSSVLEGGKKKAQQQFVLHGTWSVLAAHVQILPADRDEC